MKRTITAIAAVCAICLLASCAKDADGRRLTIAEQWNAMAARQDAAARDFVDTGKDNQDPSQAARDRSARFSGTTTF